MDIIGRREKIVFTEWGLSSIDAKVDTGAYGSALHSHDIEICRKEGKDMLRFKLLDPTHPEYEHKDYYASEFSDKVVKSSSGLQEHRFSVRTEISLAGRIFRVEFSLTDRSEMRYPVLLGRKFLKKRFLVDVAKKYILK